MTKKIIVISDLHISNGASYSKFIPNYSNTAIQVIKNFAYDSSITDLVLLGDIFDLWMYPIDVKPLTVQEIINVNPEFTTAIRACVAALPNVYYVNGNHDLGLRIDDLEFFTNDGKYVKQLPSGGLCAGLHLEHGHSVDIFNAPDDSPGTIGGYPLGFFITRLAAGSGKLTEFNDFFTRKVKEFLFTYQAMEETLRSGKAGVELKIYAHKSVFVEFLIDALAAYSHVPKKSPIRFSEPGLDGKFTVEDIKKHYSSLLHTWWERYPNLDTLKNSMLSSLMPNGLDWYASALLAKGNPDAHKMVAMGHTHHSEDKQAYVNSGCCCRSAHEKCISYGVITGDDGVFQSQIVKIKISYEWHC